MSESEPTPVKEFWAGAASGASRKALAKAQRWLDGPRPSRIMVNYQTKNNSRDSRWRQYDLFVDPGAYSLFAPSPVGQGLDDYPESTGSYLQAVGNQQPARYAWRDYVCEPDVREHHNRTVAEQQERTLDRHIECADGHEDLGISAEPVAVVQGWDPDDYREHAQALADHGLVTDRVGIGTMCGREDVAVCEDIIAAVREVLPDVDLHAFGLDSACYSSEYIMDEIRSTDSLAYCWQYRRPAGWSRTEYVLMKYLRHRARWDEAVTGQEYRSRETPDRSNHDLEQFA